MLPFDLECLNDRKCKDRKRRKARREERKKKGKRDRNRKREGRGRGWSKKKKKKTRGKKASKNYEQMMIDIFAFESVRTAFRRKYCGKK